MGDNQGEHWDSEYRDGMWEYLNDPLEKSRYAIIAAHSQHYHPGGRVLDVGCGEALLYDFLSSDQKEGYLGIDISEEAMRLARSRRNATVRTADAYNFEAEQSFEVIVFNEVIYYLNFGRIFQKYADLVSENGLVMVSIFRVAESFGDVPFSVYEDRIWDEAKKYFDMETIINLSGESDQEQKQWKIVVMKKRLIS